LDPIPVVLIVEDDEAMRQMYALGLGAQGFAVEIASTAAQAALKVRELMPAVTLMDIGLPDGSGLDVLERLREDPLTASLPVVMFTNYNEPGMLDRSTKAGAADFLVKVETTPAKVAAVVSDLLQKAAGAV
jgi:two-component system cell cycle response regulator